MLTYTPGSTVVHRLDPRTKLCFQFGFAVAAFATPTVLRLAGLFVVGIASLSLSGLAIREALRAYWFVLLVLLLGPLIAAITLGSPWLRLDPAIESLRSVARIVPILFVSAAYIHATPVRDTRAAIQQTIPGRPGQLLGVGVALTFRYIPVLRDDLRQIRDAVSARGGDTRSMQDRTGRIATLILARALSHSDRLSVALQTRCFAWNPTLPRLEFARRDYLVLGATVLLAATVFVPL
ncbi:MAG: energy-coupling factor transporter transmembrane component T [Halovenus sp.]|uniref:energy-coupling factor transporter transmembrane component T family protein n=1 Tax=Halovenus amylolytica TaxID=2500550 RepID=UPI000FE30AD8